MERKNAWEKYSEEDRKKVFDFAEEYRGFRPHIAASSVGNL